MFKVGDAVICKKSYPDWNNENFKVYYFKGSKYKVTSILSGPLLRIEGENGHTEIFNLNTQNEIFITESEERKLKILKLSETIKNNK